MNRIKLLREEFGYTQQDLANKLQCSKSIIGLYENETRKPSLEVLIKLSQIFKCSIDYILYKTNVRIVTDTIKEQFNLKYYKEMEGLTEEEIADALIFYKKIKYGK